MTPKPTHPALVAGSALLLTGFLAACHDPGPTQLSRDVDAQWAKGGRGGGGGGDPTYQLAIASGVVAGPGSVAVTKDNHRDLILSGEPYPVDAVDLQLTYALSAGASTAPLDPGSPSCSLGDYYDQLPTSTRDSVLAILRHQLLRGPSNGQLMLGIDKTMLDQAHPDHYMFIYPGGDPDLRRLDIGKANGGGIDRYPVAEFLGHGDGSPNPDVNDSTRPRIFEIRGGVTRSLVGIGNAPSDPAVGMVCWNLDVIRVTVSSVAP